MRKFFFKPLRARNVHEEYRVATPLELFFDLVTVISFSSVAHGLYHALLSASPLLGVVKFLVLTPNKVL